MERRRRPGGFTLVELMVVVAIISIIAIITVPALLEYNGEQSSRDVSRRVTMHFKGLRSLATTTGQALVVRINEGNLSDQMGSIQVFPSTTNRCSNATNVANPNLSLDLTGLTRDNVQIVHMSPGGGGALRLCFKPDGSVVNLSGQPLSKDSTSATDGCDESGAEWGGYCDRNGVACFKVSALNEGSSASKKCWGVDSQGEPSHLGEDHIILLSFNGGAKMVR